MSLNRTTTTTTYYYYYRWFEFYYYYYNYYYSLSSNLRSRTKIEAPHFGLKGYDQGGA